MKCLHCGEHMMERQEVRRSYSGLEDVLIEGVLVRHCPDCGEEEVGYSNVEQLHARLALQLSTKKTALTPNEIRFVSTWLGAEAVV